MRLRLCSPWCSILLLATAVGGAGTGYGTGRTTPIHKVIELLTVLKRQLTKDGQDDGARFENFTRWYGHERASDKKILAETNQTIQALTSDLKSQATLRESLKQKLERLVSELSKNERELKEAVTLRTNERKEFESSESDLLEGIDQLERALVVLSKGKAGAGQQRGGLNLLAIAKQLRRTLERSPDLALSDAERETLNGFFSTAAVHSHHSAAGSEFLQARDGDASDSGPPAGEAAASITTMLQNVLLKTQKELEDERKKEAQAQQQFKAFETALQTEIQNKQKSIAETKMSISQSQEKSGQMTAQLQEANELLKVCSEHLQQLEAENAVKIKYYKERVAKRTDELLAVQEASQILTSEAMQRLVQPAAGAPKQPAFIQLQQVTRRKVLHTLKHATSPGLALMAIRTRIDEADSFGTDPFAKVKRMIQDMLQRLQEAQSKDAQRASWCDTEMTKSTKSLEEKKEDTMKLKDRIAAMDAELAQLTSDVTTLSHDLDAMKGSVAAAAKLRQEDHQKAIAALTQYRDAQKLIKLAIGALARFYDKEAAAAAKGAAPKGEAFHSSDMSSGVTAILEVALQDYADLEHKTEQSEASAQKDFKAMMDESEVRSAVFSKDLEYKSREKVRLEAERMRANADLLSYDKELAAVLTYLDKLQATCIGKPDTFEERKGRRDTELKSLQGALQFLNGEGLV